MTLQVIISQPDGDLTMDGVGGAGLWVQSVSRPGRTWRRTRVTSPWMHGAPQKSAVLEVSEVALTVVAQASSASALNVLRKQFEAALFQIGFDLTITEDGVTDVYSADCGDCQWQPYSSGHTRAGVSVANCTIPVHPISTPGAP